MEGVLPLSLSLTDDSARLVGAYVRLGLIEVVRPPLDSIDFQLQSMNRTLRLMTLAIAGSAVELQFVRLRVQIMNEDLLDHIEATRWAVAYLSYNKFLELLDLLRSMRWLDGRSHIHLHDIIAALGSVEGALAALSAELTFIGAAVAGLLQAILDQLWQGIGLTGQIQIIVSTGGLGDFLKTLDLWKLLGLLVLLAVGLGAIVAFLFGVGAALATFGEGAFLAAIAIGALVVALTPLMNTLAGYDWEQLGKIGAGFLGIAGFVALLGKAFAMITSDLEKIVPQLDTFFTAIARLMSTLSGFDVGQLAKIGAGFLGIAGFVALLGKAFAMITSDLEKIVPQLDAFFTAIARLMSTLSGFDVAQLFKIGAGFLGIAGFVWLLGKALATLTDQALGALPALAQFFDAIARLMATIAAFSIGQLFAIAAGFLLIAGFVWGLSMALGTFTLQAVAAIPGLTQLLGALGSLAQLMASMSVGEMVAMGIGLALIALFVWAVAAALVYAAGPLAALATIFASFGAVLEAVSSIASGLWSVLSDIGGAIGDVFGAIGGVVGDVFAPVDVDAMRAQMQAQASSSAIPAVPPPVAGAPAAAELGALAPGAALAAAPAGAPGAVDQSVNVNGGITVTVNAERLEADSAALLSDDIVAQLQQRLGSLRAEQDFRAGARPTA